MKDVRESILARLLVVLKSIDGLKTVVRNRGELTDDQLPAVYILDADEASEIITSRPDDQRPRGRPSILPDLIRLLPELYIQLPSALPQNQQVGSVINSWRAKVISSIMGDSELQSLVGANGSIRYVGCVTDLARGRAMAGMMQIIVAFTYVLRASEL